MSICKHKECLDSKQLISSFSELAFFKLQNFFFKASVMWLLRCGWTPAEGFSNPESKRFPKIFNGSRKYRLQYT